MSALIRKSFLLAQEREGMDLAEASDILSLEPLGPSPHERFVARFAARSVITDEAGPREANGVYDVGIWFPNDYHRRAVTPQVLSWLRPREVFHPNVLAPFICLGTLRPGTPIVEICFRVWSLIAYQSYGLKSPLNPAAAAWARRHLDRFPVDRRPLKRRIATFTTQVFEKGGVA